MAEQIKIRYERIVLKGFRGRNFTLEIPNAQQSAIFMMDGNTGKTTTIELLRWCFLFKESEAIGKFRHMWNNPAHILDNEKKGNQSCSISVYFIDNNKNHYKYERVCLLIVDFSKTVPKLYSSDEQLKVDGLLPEGSKATIKNLNYETFVSDLLKVYNERFGENNFK